jgi:hypothetical protein
MDGEVRSIGSPSRVEIPTEVPMVREDVVREMLARLARGEGIKGIARELGVDRKDSKGAAPARRLAAPDPGAPAAGRRRVRDLHRAAGSGGRLE